MMSANGKRDRIGAGTVDCSEGNTKQTLALAVVNLTKSGGADRERGRPGGAALLARSLVVVLVNCLRNSIVIVARSSPRELGRPASRSLRGQPKAIWKARLVGRPPGRPVVSVREIFVRRAG